MELPQHQVQRIFEAEGRKPTHDFLSLCTHANMQLQDPIRSPSSQGYLKTHDFLQPLERVGKTTAKEERAAETSSLERPPPPPSVEHILPGGIGTYSINHISSYFNQRVPKPEGDPIFSASSTEKNEEHSNCSSYTGSGFTLWEESAMKKGKTGKENVVEKSNVVRDAATKVGQWTKPERPSQSSTNNHHNSFSSLSSSRPSGQKSQSFMEMINSGRDDANDDNLEEEEDFVLKKETPSPIHKGELRVKVDGKSTDQKANTPRSKHSATEQRRRSKINDRFQMLRELIPHGDQKRDKASFLLEVIEYIQFLQQKVHKYEGSYQGWNREPAKLVPWRNGNRTAENPPDQPRGISGGAGPGLLIAAKLEESSINLAPNIPGSSQNLAESDVNSATTLKVDHYPAAVYKGMPFPQSLQSNFLNWSRSAAVAQLPPRLVSDVDNVTTQSQLQPNQSISCTTDAAVAGKLKEQELSVEGGTINISSLYSQGLLNTLTQALQSSGVDLSQASISVQIDIGKRASTRTEVPTSTTKGNEVHCSNEEAKRPRASRGEESDTLIKKLKTSKS